MVVRKTPYTNTLHPVPRLTQPFEANLRHDWNFGARERYDKYGGLDVAAGVASTYGDELDRLTFDGVADTLLFSSLAGVRNCPDNCLAMNIPALRFTAEITLSDYTVTPALSLLVGGGTVVPGQFSWGITQTNGLIQGILSPDGSVLDVVTAIVNPAPKKVVITYAVTPTLLVLYFDGELVGSGARTAPTVNNEKLFSLASAFGALHTPIDVMRFRMWDTTIDATDPRLYKDAISARGA